MVRREGVEPSILSAPPPQDGVYTVPPPTQNLIPPLIKNMRYVGAAPTSRAWKARILAVKLITQKW